MFIRGNIPVKRAGLLSSPARGKSKEEKQIFQWILWDERGSWETRRALTSSPESLRPPGLAGHSERVPGWADPAAVGHEGRGQFGCQHRHCQGRNAPKQEGIRRTGCRMEFGICSGPCRGSAVRGAASRDLLQQNPELIRPPNLPPLGKATPQLMAQPRWVPAGSHCRLTGLLSQRFPGNFPGMLPSHPKYSSLPSLFPSIQGSQVLCAVPTPRPGLAAVAGGLLGLGG